jgi:hypothetical protein
MAATAPKTDKEWEAESDADTLARAGEIKRDKKRMNRALIAAMRMAKEQRIKAEELEKVAKAKKSK